MCEGHEREKLSCDMVLLEALTTLHSAMDEFFESLISAIKNTYLPNIL